MDIQACIVDKLESDGHSSDQISILLAIMVYITHIT